MNSVSYVSQQRGSPGLSAFKIFRSSSCLLELRRGMVSRYLCVKSRALPGSSTSGHFYCYDFGKSLLDTTTRL